MPEHKENQPRSGSRRNFLKVSGAALGGVVVGGVVGAVLNNSLTKPKEQPPAATPEEQPPAADFNQALMYFNQEQFRITEAAVERIFPKDELGPGAIELDVAYYIDHQLANQWGINARDYMMGPFFKGEMTQGEYPSIKRHELFSMGLDALKGFSMKKYNKPFTELEDNEKDEVLKSFEAGKDVILSNGDTTASFFKMLRSLALEGSYSDPLYGGNKNMMGWKMRNYPGNQMSYLNIIDKPDFVKIEPKSLHEHMTH